VVEADAVASIFEMEASNAATATVKGVVKDAVTGQPVSRAVVSSDLGDSTVADDKGAFTLVVEPDDHVFSARADGYFAGASVPVTIKVGETQDITLTLPPPGPNLAKEGKPISSSEDSSNTAANIIDGNLDTYWQTATDKHGGEWVGVQWSTPQTFTVVQLRGVITTVQNSYLEVLAEDGKTWVELPKTRFNVEFNGANQDFFFPEGVKTTALRWFAALTWGVEDNPGLSELMVFNSPIPK
jgi:Carboxypeptidase regulatory-like domain/F5/8 type C domain